MKDGINFNISQFQKGRKAEEKFYENFKENLIWNNEQWNENDQYDSELPSDFTIKNTKINIDLQFHDFQRWNQVILYKRKFYNYKIEAQRIIYLNPKNLNSLLIVASDGDNLIYKRADRLNFQWTENNGFKRLYGEEICFIPVSDFKRAKPEEFNNLLIKCRKDRFSDTTHLLKPSVMPL